MHSKKDILKCFLILCSIAIGISIVSFQIDWIMFLIKKDNLVRVEASIEKIRYQKKHYGGRYKTSIKYYYKEDVFGKEITTDKRDMNANTIYVCIEKDYPDKVYRDKMLYPPNSTDTALTILLICFDFLIILSLCILKIQSPKDYRIPND